MSYTIYNPLFWVMVVFGLYFFMKNQIWKKRLKYICILLFVILTNNWVSTSVLHLWEYETINAKDIKEPYDIGIVLGPFLDEDKYLPIRSESIRFTQAVQLYKQNKFDKFLISGNDKADLTRQHLIELCVPPEDILVEDKSNNTYENAVLSSRFLSQRGDISKRILLITSAYHMRRAKKCFDKVGLKVTPLSVDYKTSKPGWSIKLKKIIPNQNALWQWELLFHECASTIFFRLKNFI